jgi:hypothetical protein
MAFWTQCEKLIGAGPGLTMSIPDKRKMLTQEFRTFIHSIEEDFSGDEDDDFVLMGRRIRTLKLIFESLVREGLEARYTGNRGLRRLRSDLQPCLEQEGLTVYGLMFFSSGGIFREELDMILDEYRLCVADPAGYVAPIEEEEDDE